MQIELKKCWKTSRGIFDSIELSMKNKNRAKIMDYNSPNFGKREFPIEIYVLYCPTNCKYFDLKEIEIKSENG